MNKYKVVPIPDKIGRVSRWDGLCQQLRKTEVGKALEVPIGEDREMVLERVCMVNRARTLGMCVQSKIDPAARTITIWRSAPDKIKYGRKRKGKG